MLVRRFAYRNHFLVGRRILFLTDLHFRSQCVYHFPYPCLSWCGVEKVASEILDLAEQIKPDYTVFGGDLATESAQLPAAFHFLAALPAKRAKIAVRGNWDAYRKPWLNESVWRNEYGKAGFQLLINQSLVVDEIDFYGMDEAKTGKPAYVSKRHPEKARIVVAHSPDVADAFDFSDADLVLCGHTHGGQIRIPFFGAVATSTKCGKKYEYGEYNLPPKNIPMLVSSGIGATWFPLRVFCPPEICCIDFEG